MIWTYDGRTTDDGRTHLIGSFEPKYNLSITFQPRWVKNWGDNAPVVVVTCFHHANADWYFTRGGGDYTGWIIHFRYYGLYTVPCKPYWLLTWKRCRYSIAAMMKWSLAAKQHSAVSVWNQHQIMCFRHTRASHARSFTWSKLSGVLKIGL